MTFYVRVTVTLFGLLAMGPALPAQGLTERATLKCPRTAYVAFSPDGKTLASGCMGFDSRSREGDLRLWDVATGRERLALRCHNYAVARVAFSPDGRMLATAGEDQTVKVWDLAEGEGRLTLQERATFRLSFSQCRRVAFSPDGKRLAAAGDREVKLWDVVTRGEIASYGRRVAGWNPALSPDLRTLASPNYQDVDLWDLATGKERPPLLDHRGGVSCMAFSADGRTLAVGVGWGRPSEEGNKPFSEVKLWDWAAGKERLTLKERPTHLFDLTLSPDGKLLVLVETKKLGKDRELKLLALPSGRVLATVSFKGREDSPLSLAFGANGKLLAAGCFDGAVRLWDVLPAQETGPSAQPGRPARRSGR
jgi:WD40 repeat protein